MKATTAMGLAFMAVLALSSSAHAQEDEHDHEEVTETCAAALDRLVEFMEVEAGHDHSEEEGEEEEHDHSEEEGEEETHILEALTCGNGTFTVEFEGEEYTVPMDEFEYDGCAADDDDHCERLLCEDGELHLARYHGCCSEILDSSEPEEECHVEVEASESTTTSTSTSAAIWGKAIGATLLSALSSLIGVVLIIGKKKTLNEAIMNDVSALAIGFLLSTVFVHLLPEAAETAGFEWQTGTAFLGGVMTALFIQMGSAMIGLHHTHSPTDLEDGHENIANGKVDAEDHSNGTLDYPLISNIVIGDGIHNLVDGMLIAIGFAACPGSAIGWITLGSVLAHELPQEMVDFVVLVRAGLSFKAALFFNFCSQMTCLIGAVAVLAVNATINESAQAYVLVYGAGFLAYVALAELTPTLINVDSKARRAFRMFLIVAGAVLIGVLGLLHQHCHADGDDHSDHNH
ncbi:Zinc transporter ZIP12 [Hondaea fermentalgiana]|uniref:Zinc transporter ZIP12 n=1 Tax=Hondaea fermentalgiana TaxID=2315210 RepID=A0A2R5GRU2_9STRA|nr:Zinc transporter ZIP12 [Hondaea fermentalgiana]|eukprot:GBG32478.1 Zinc transporter ZIP12 [Hondaea fermentalgiana]